MNTLQIDVTITLEARRSKAQQLALQQWITERIEEALDEINGNAGLGDRNTFAEDHRVGHIMLTSKAGLTEICA